MRATSGRCSTTTKSPSFARDSPRIKYERTKSIPRAFLGSFGGRFVLTGIAFIITVAMVFTGPIVLNHVVSELASGEYDVSPTRTRTLMRR